jgi:hypothetical protein
MADYVNTDCCKIALPRNTGFKAPAPEQPEDRASRLRLAFHFVADAIIAHRFPLVQADPDVCHVQRSEDRSVYPGYDSKRECFARTKSESGFSFTVLRTSPARLYFIVVFGGSGLDLLGLD